MRRLPLSLLPLLAAACAPAPPPAPAPVYVEAKDCDRTTPGPFDRACTAKALASIDVSDCHRESVTAPSSGHLKLTFLASGQVARAQVDTSGLAGTAAGRCVEDHFKQAHVPPFEGEPVTIGNAFTLSR